jgi:hypothetical protein
MKTGLDALDTAENESGSAKHENGTQRPRYRLKCDWERKTWKRDPTPSVQPKNVKKEPDALGTAENESGSAKREKGTRRPRYRWKRVRERKTW